MNHAPGTEERFVEDIDIRRYGCGRSNQVMCSTIDLAQFFVVQRMVVSEECGRHMNTEIEVRRPSPLAVHHVELNSGERWSWRP